VRRVDVIVNRLAHHLVGETGLRAHVQQAARHEGATVHETRSLAELDEVARLLSSRGTDCVVLAGGDGSYMAGVTALDRSFGGKLPPVAFAPGGTVGTVARNWGMRRPLDSYVSRLLGAIRRGDATPSERPTLRVTDAEDRRFVGFIFGAGLVANFFDVYYGGSHLGYGAAAAIVARVFAGSFVGGRLASRVLARTPCVLRVDGVERSPRAYSLITASVVRDLGLRMRVLYRAAEERDRFHVVASALEARALGPQLPRVLAARPLRGADHVDTLARELSVAFSAESGVYVLDGEALRARDVVVTAGPVIMHLST